MNAIFVFCAPPTNSFIVESVCENVKSALFESVGFAGCAEIRCENAPAAAVAIAVANVLLLIV